MGQLILSLIPISEIPGLVMTGPPWKVGGGWDCLSRSSEKVSAILSGMNCWSVKMWIKNFVDESWPGQVNQSRDIKEQERLRAM